MADTIQFGLELDFRRFDSGAKQADSILDRLEKRLDSATTHIVRTNQSLHFDGAKQGDKALSQVSQTTVKVSQSARSLAKDVGGIEGMFRRLATSAGSSLGGIRSGLGALSGMAGRGGIGSLLGLGGGGLALGAAGVVGGGVVAGLGALAYGYKKVLDVGIPFNDLLERTRIQFRTLLRGTGEDVDSYIKQLFKLTDETEFNFPQIAQLAAQLKAAKFEAKDIPGVIRSVSDAVAAVGGGSEGLDRIVLALRQIKGAARVSAEELNQLLDANVPVFDIIQKRTGLRSDQFRKLAEDNKINAEVFIKYLLEGFDQEFGGAQKEIAIKTVDGLLSSFNDALDRRAGEASVNASATLRKTIEVGLTGLQSGTASSLAKGVDDLTGTITGPLNKFLEGVAKGNFADAGKGLVNDVVSGVTGTVKEKAAEVWESGKSIGGGLLDGAKKILGINSPSLEFGEIGRNIGLGLIEGVDSIEGAVLARINDLMDNVLMVGQRRGGSGQAGAYTPAEARQRVESLVDDPRIRAFLDTIAKAEGANYNTLFGGGRFSSFDAHPNQRITRTMGGKPITSTAAGRYQFLSRTWDSVSKFLGLDSFSPRNQDIAAVELLRRRGVLDEIMGGDIGGALTGANREWASLPGSPYGQPTKKASTLVDFYNKRLSGMGGSERLAQVMEAIVAPLTKLADSVPMLQRPMEAIASSQGPARGTIFGGEIITEVTARRFEELPLNLEKISTALDDSKVRAAADELARLGKELERLGGKPQSVNKPNQREAKEELLSRPDDSAKYYSGVLRNAFRDFTTSALTDIGSLREAFSSALNTVAQGIIQRFTTKLTDTLFTKFIDPLLDKVFGGNSVGGGGKGGGILNTIFGFVGNFISGLFGGVKVGGTPKPSGVPTFAVGGYTGNGGMYQPAGIVHANEYVMDRRTVSAYGVAYLDRMRASARRGFAGGGYTGGVAMVAGGRAVTINQTLIIQAKDVDSFRRSQPQITREMARAVRDAGRFE